jgi:hypothetical protein
MTLPVAEPVIILNVIEMCANGSSAKHRVRLETYYLKPSFGRLIVNCIDDGAILDACHYDVATDRSYEAILLVGCATDYRSSLGRPLVTWAEDDVVLGPGTYNFFVSWHVMIPIRVSTPRVEGLRIS